MKRKLIYAIIILIALLIARKVNAQDGQLDMSFADSGKVINSIGSTADIGWSGEAHSTLIQSDGKLLLSGLRAMDHKLFLH